MSEQSHSPESKRQSEAPAEIDEEFEEIFRQLREENPILKYYHDNPYKAIAIASGLGYIVAGGLFTSFSKRLARIGMKGLFIPLAAQKFEQLTDVEPGDSGLETRIESQDNSSRGE